MINKKLKSWLKEHPGYLKKGWIYIYNMPQFKLSGSTIRDTMKSTKKEILLKEQTDYLLQQAKIVSSTDKILEKAGMKNHTGTILRNSYRVGTKGHVFKEFTKQYNVPGIHIIMPCVHIPYHNEKFYNAFKNYVKTTNVKGFHIIGDFLDMNALSGHDKGNVGQTTLDFEYSAGNACLDDLGDILPSDCIRTYIWGNHEDRYNRYMKNVDNAKLGTALQSPTVGLDLVNRGFHVFENWKQSYITIGKYLTLSHGEFCNVHTAKKHIDTYRKSVMYAHTHRKQVYIEGDTGGFNIGSMADFSKDAFGYATRAMKESWINSFAIVYIDSDGYYHVEIPTWINNKFVIGDKIFI